MNLPPEKPALKPLLWVASSKVDLMSFPDEVRRSIGHSLHLVQAGETPINAKPLRGFGGATVLEIVERHPAGAFRTVYTVRFAEAVFVLHAFQKKSTKGIATRKTDIDLIRRRLTLAGEEYRQLYGSENL